MKILLCNDDGIHSGGLKALADILVAKNQLLIIAPDGNRSCTSHSLTLFKPVKITENFDFKDCRAYAISGTPADCVKIGFTLFKDFMPDIVIAGINKGHNLGSDILYSGTVSAAFEGAFSGVTSFAFSAYSHGEHDFSLFAEYADRLVTFLMPYSAKDTVWNINFPEYGLPVKGVKPCVLGKYVYNDRYVKNDSGEYEIVSSITEAEGIQQNSDVLMIKQGFITVTPLLLNRTDKGILRLMDTDIKL